MFVDVAADGDLAEGGMISVKADGVQVLLCRNGGRIFATDRRCGHEGAALNLGTIKGHIVTCPLHFAQFDVATGKALLGPADKNYGKGGPDRGGSTETRDLRTYEVKVENGRILVDPSPSPR